MPAPCPSACAMTPLSMTSAAPKSVIANSAACALTDGWD
jgi:hypothetical protein